MGMIYNIPQNHCYTDITNQLLWWSETECKTNHRDTWPQTLTFKSHLKILPKYKIMTNIFRGHRFKVGGSKK